MTEVINAAHARGIRVVPTITMMAWNSDYSAMSTLLNSSTYRARLVADVVKVVGDRRADGVNIDFEPVPRAFGRSSPRLCARSRPASSTPALGPS